MNLPWQSGTSRTVDVGRRLASALALVVDDADAMRKITANQLRQMGVQRVLQAADGQEALKLMATQPVNLIVADWQMPGMDGLELLAQVRALPKGASIPFVLLTLDAPRERVIDAVRLGVSELLVKPYTAGRFIERIERALYWTPVQAHTRSAAPVTTVVTATGDAVRPTLMVVDDTPDNLDLLSELFKDIYRVKVANHGARAIALCQSEDPPDLVLLDVMMPDMDGFEVAQALRRHPTSEDIPVIFVTALADDASRLRGLTLGAVDFVTKPIQPDMLRVRVANFMRFVDLRRHLQADYDHLLAAQRERDVAARGTWRDLREPLERALVALDAEQPGSALARQEIEGLLVGLAARETCQELADGRYAFQPERLPLMPWLRALVEKTDRETAAQHLQWHVKVAHGLDDDEVIATGDRALLWLLLQALLRGAAEGLANDSALRVSVWMRNAVRIDIEWPGTAPVAGWDACLDDILPGPLVSLRRVVEAQKALLAHEIDEARGLARWVLTLPTERDDAPPAGTPSHEDA